MTEQELISITSEYSRQGTTFGLWCEMYINEALQEWHETMEEAYPCVQNFVEMEIALNFAAGWLFECRDKEEVNALLESWYNDRKKI